jgi:dihydrofolate synthase/folylpolyglutamate synthase
VKLGLARIRGLLRELGHPERTFRGALVAGTNGKGSVLALAGAALEVAGHRVGRTPKPHLVTYRERLAVGERIVEPDEFARLVAETLPAAERVARRHGEISEFEFLTAVAFLWFARERVDLALVEVGLGGRLDATNAWDGGVAAITNVDWDHMDRLGNTLAAIGREKAAIIKRGDVAVTGATGPGLRVIRDRARRLEIPLTEVAPFPIQAVHRDGLVVAAGERFPGGLRVGLRGRHQAANAAVALALLDALGAAGIASVDAGEIDSGFAAAVWPGRLERIVRAGADGIAREIWLDGAHNAAGAAALAEAFVELRPLMAPGPLTLVLGIMEDKDVPAVLRGLAPLAGAGPEEGTRIITTRVVDSPRAMSPRRLAEEWREAAMAAGMGAPDAIPRPDPPSALQEALGGGQGGPILVAGSLYLVGAMRALLVDDPNLRDPEAA